MAAKVEFKVAAPVTVSVDERVAAPVTPSAPATDASPPTALFPITDSLSVFARPRIKHVHAETPSTVIRAVSPGFSFESATVSDVLLAGVRLTGPAPAFRRRMTLSAPHVAADGIGMVRVLVPLKIKVIRCPRSDFVRDLVEVKAASEVSAACVFSTSTFEFTFV
ncbi:hypothetical protein, partial [Caballeronia pedi]|uniref:hypothetical protein n=1 Tax=Caballeronia pedi TaxID=1777141 RepID=UPI001ABFD6CE